MDSSPGFDASQQTATPPKKTKSKAPTTRTSSTSDANDTADSSKPSTAKNKKTTQDVEQLQARVQDLETRCATADARTAFLFKVLTGFYPLPANSNTVRYLFGGVMGLACIFPPQTNKQTKKNSLRNVAPEDVQFALEYLKLNRAWTNVEYVGVVIVAYFI